MRYLDGCWSCGTGTARGCCVRTCPRPKPRPRPHPSGCGVAEIALAVGVISSLIISVCAYLKSIRNCKNLETLARELISFEQLVQQEIDDIRPPTGTMLEILPTSDPIGGIYYPSDGTMGSTYWYRLSTNCAPSLIIGQTTQEAVDYLLSLSGLVDADEKLVSVLVDALAKFEGEEDISFAEAASSVQSAIASANGKEAEMIIGSAELIAAIDQELRKQRGTPSESATGSTVDLHCHDLCPIGCASHASIPPLNPDQFTVQCTELCEIWKLLGEPPLVTGEDGFQYFQINSGINPEGPTTMVVVGECASEVVYCRTYDPVSGTSTFTEYERPAEQNICIQ